MGKEKQCPSNNFARIMKTVRLISLVVGADIADPHYRVNWITIAVIFCISMYFIFTITTIIDVFAENWTYMLEASCMLGSVLQGITKLGTGIIYTKRFSGISCELQCLYMDYEKLGEKYCTALNESCKRTIRIVKIVGVIYGFSVAGIICTPIILHILTGRHYLMMHFLVPMLEVNTDFGYLVTMIAHLSCMIAGGFGLYAGDLFFLIFLTQPILFNDILKLKIEELNECAEENGENTIPLLHDLIKWHQFYTEYNDRINDTFSYINAVQISTSGISILCTMYILLFGDWPGVYVYFVLATCALYIYCIMGTRIETCNDRFYEEIYNINWYKLPPIERKMVSLMLLKSEYPSNIKVGGVVPLSVDTALSITKSLYGVFTMMLRLIPD